MSRYFGDAGFGLQGGPARFGRHFVPRHTGLVFQQQQLQVRQILAARPEARQPLLPQLLFQRLDFQLRPTQFLLRRTDQRLERHDLRGLPLPLLLARIRTGDSAHGEESV